MIDNCILYYVIRVMQANVNLNLNRINIAMPVFLQCLPVYYIAEMGNNKTFKT